MISPALPIAVRGTAGTTPAEEVGQPPAQPGGHAGVAGQERAQPDRDDRPGVGRVQPGRAARGPGQQQVALMRELLGPVRRTPAQRAHAGVDAVDRIAAAQHRPCRTRSCRSHLRQQRRVRARSAARPRPAGSARRPGHRAAITMASVAGLRPRMVTGTAASCRHRRRAARRRISAPTAMSRMDSPRCQSRIRSSGRSRPGRWPATIWPSSACRDRGRQPAGVDVRPQRAEPPGLRLPPVVDDDLVHHVEQVKLDGADRAVRDDERAGPDRAGAQQRLGRGQPGGLDQDVRAVERLVRGGGDPDRRGGDRRPGCRANASRDSGRRLVTRISSRSNISSSSTTFQNAVPRAPTCPSTRASGRARYRAPTAVIAPVRQAVIRVASMIDSGIPVAGSYRVSSPSSLGRPLA